MIKQAIDFKDFLSHRAVQHVLLSLFMVGGLAGCEATAQIEKLPPLPTTIAPVAPAAQNVGPYHLQMGDVLDLKFPLNPELNETVTVRPDGMISTSIAADVPAYNLTVKELNAELKEAYRGQLVSPDISVVVRSFVPSRIYVSGEVASPGEFIVVGPNLTLTQAIARAGGTLNSADGKRVMVIRRGAGEEGQAFVANYFAATQGGDPSQDARLAPYDVVFVPKSGAALTYKNYQQYFQQYVTPSIGVSASYDLNN